MAVATRFIILSFLSYFALYHGTTLVQGRRLSSSITTTQRERSSAFYGDHVHNMAGCAVSGDFHGVKATLSVHQLTSLSSNQTSTSSIVIRGPPTTEANVIEVGWHVSPERYGDTQTRFFVHWIADSDIGKSSGCYDLGCPGFLLQDNSPIAPGDVMNTAVGVQDVISLTIYQDMTTRDWWLLYDDNVHQGVKVGHWPRALFSSLINAKASHITFGGDVLYLETGPSPPMGAGVYPPNKEEGSEMEPSQAAFFRNLQYMDTTGNFNNFLLLDLSVDYDPPCYNATIVRSGEGMELFYGGPGCN